MFPAIYSSLDTSSERRLGPHCYSQPAPCQVQSRAAAEHAGTVIPQLHVANPRVRGKDLEIPELRRQLLAEPRVFQEVGVVHMDVRRKLLCPVPRQLQTCPK